MSTSGKSFAGVIETEESLSQKEGVSLSNTAKESRSDARAVVLEADARSEGSAEFVNNLPQEKLGEDKKSGGGGQASSSYYNDEEEEKMEEGIASLELPSPRVMARKIKSAVQKELHVAEKQVRKYGKNARKYAFELSNALSALRNLRAFLSDLVEKSVAFLENIWKHLREGGKIADILE